MNRKEHGILGEQAVSSGVGYHGVPYAPVPGTYRGVDAVALNWTTDADTGLHPRRGAELGNLYPLVCAAMYEAGFAAEFGPLTSWNN